MRRHGWDGYDWGRHRGEWSKSGMATWQGFGRRIFVGFLLMAMLLAATLFAVGAFVAALVSSVWIFLFLAPLIFIAFVAIAIRSGLRAWRPVRSLVTAAGELADGDYSVRVAPSGSATSRRVLRSFNEMAGRLQNADAQRRQLLADLGHELRTPLTVVRGEIEAMLDGVHQPGSEQFQMLLDEVAVMERLLEDLRTLSMAESGVLALHPEPTDLVALVQDAVESHRRAAEDQAVAILFEAGDGVGEIVVDPVRVREVVSNLVVNALRAMPDGGALRVRTLLERSWAIVEIKDTGMGIPPEEIDHVFERFKKGSASAGSGLGLTISRDLVEAHGGTIRLESVSSVGTRVVVRLPAVRG